MRGREEERGAMLLSITPEELVPRDHPIKRIRAITDRVLQEMSPVLGTMYSGLGRPSVAPERLLKASILMALYSVRSERQFCERLQYDLLFKWFLNMNIATPAFDHASFSKNRERLIQHQVAEQFFAAVVEEATKARLCFGGHVLMENRNGLVLDVLVTQASGTAERDATLVMLDRRKGPRKRVTLGTGRDSRATTRVPSSKNSASARSPRMSPSTRRGAGVQSTGGRRSTRATGLGSGCASASRRSSAG